MGGDRQYNVDQYICPFACRVSSILGGTDAFCQVQAIALGCAHSWLHMSKAFDQEEIKKKERLEMKGNPSCENVVTVL